MADENTNNQTAQHVPSIEVGAPSVVTTVDLNKDGEASNLKTVEEGGSVQLGNTATPKAENAEGTDTVETEGGNTEGTDTETNADADADSEASEEALPEFDFNDASVVEAYDKRYTKDDGEGGTELNLHAFNSSLAAARDAGEKIDISASERAYVKKVYGISDAAIDQHIEGLVAKAEKFDAKVASDFGGEDRVQGAYAWAADNYTQAQKDSYNAALKQFQKDGDHSKVEVELELLNARFSKASPKTDGKVPGKTFRDRRPSNPEQQASKVNTAAKAADVFANSEEHRIAQQEAHASGSAAKVKAVSDKLRRSMAQPDWA